MSSRKLISNNWDGLYWILSGYIIIWANPWWLFPIAFANIVGFLDGQERLNNS